MYFDTERIFDTDTQIPFQTLSGIIYPYSHIASGFGSFNIHKVYNWNTIPHCICKGFQRHEHCEVAQDMTITITIKHIYLISSEVIVTPHKILELEICKVSGSFAAFSE